MTLNEVLTQIHDLSDGRINGMRYPKKRFFKNFHHFFEDCGFEKFIISVRLPDGEWNCKIYKLPDGEYDYFLPDTREQDDDLWRELGVKR